MTLNWKHIKENKSTGEEKPLATRENLRLCHR